jgi:hypothetical protein
VLRHQPLDAGHENAAGGVHLHPTPGPPRGARPPAREAPEVVERARQVTGRGRRDRR